MQYQALAAKPGFHKNREKGKPVDDRSSRRSRTSTLRRLALTLLVLCFAVLSVRSSCVRVYRIGGASMAPTLCVGDAVWINLIAYDLRFPFTGWVVSTAGNPGPGEIVMCTLPDRRNEFIKRVLAVGGDTVELIDGRLAVNGKRLPLETLGREAFLHLETANHLGDSFAVETIGENQHAITFRSSGVPMALTDPVTVPDGHFFLIGDNRSNSWDSRYPEFGCIPRSRILGRVIGQGRTFQAPPG